MKAHKPVCAFAVELLLICCHTFSPTRVQLVGHRTSRSMPSIARVDPKWAGFLANIRYIKILYSSSTTQHYYQYGHAAHILHLSFLWVVFTMREVGAVPCFHRRHSLEWLLRSPIPIRLLRPVMFSPCSLSVCFQYIAVSAPQRFWHTRSEMHLFGAVEKIVEMTLSLRVTRATVKTDTTVQYLPPEYQGCVKYEIASMIADIIYIFNIGNHIMYVSKSKQRLADYPPPPSQDDSLFQCIQLIAPLV